MAPASGSENTLVTLTLEHHVRPDLVHWLDELRRQFGLWSREAVVSKLLESLSSDGDRA